MEYQSLKRSVSPQPIKFLGSNKESIGYIEHGGEVYTLPVTKGKYEEMMKEVAKNQGQAVDLSLEVEPQAQDLISSTKQQGAEIKRVTGEGLAKSGLAEKLDEEVINNATDSKLEQIKHHEAQIARYKSSNSFTSFSSNSNSSFYDAVNCSVLSNGVSDSIHHPANNSLPSNTYYNN